jgi:hypothetical protein
LKRFLLWDIGGKKSMGLWGIWGLWDTFLDIKFWVHIFDHYTHISDLGPLQKTASSR